MRFEFAGLQRELPLCKLQDGSTIAFLPLLGDTDLITHAAETLCQQAEFDAILCADTVGLVLGYAAARFSGCPWAAARKKRTPPMTDPLTTQVKSIASANASTLFLDRRDAALLSGKIVLLIDEVTSSGNTLDGLARLAQMAGASSMVRAVIATEGELRENVISLAHLPVIR